MSVFTKEQPVTRKGKQGNDYQEKHEIFRPLFTFPLKTVEDDLNKNDINNKEQKNENKGRESGGYA